MKKKDVKLDATLVKRYDEEMKFVGDILDLRISRDNSQISDKEIMDLGKKYGFSEFKSKRIWNNYNLYGVPNRRIRKFKHNHDKELKPYPVFHVDKNYDIDDICKILVEFICGKGATMSIFEFCEKYRVSPPLIYNQINNLYAHGKIIYKRKKKVVLTYEHEDRWHGKHEPILFIVSYYRALQKSKQTGKPLPKKFSGISEQRKKFYIATIKILKDWLLR